MRTRVESAKHYTEEIEWLSLEDAEAVVTSEEPDAPIEAALVPNVGGHWRASEPGEQSIRLRFAQPRDIREILLVFKESAYSCVQEFWLEWSDDGGATFAPVVRQQFSFSPAGAVVETETYRVRLCGLTDLALHIVPDISGGGRRATLHRLSVR